jgi:hypothetical protein
MDKLLAPIVALFLRLFGKPPRPADLPDEVPVSGEPSWLELARQDLGIKEVPGPGSNPSIMRAWRYCDYDPPNGDETAWCSGKANEWTQRAGLPGRANRMPAPG